MAALILHIDTSGPTAVVMLARGGSPVAFRQSDGERDHAGKLNFLINEVLDEAGCLLADVDAFSVCNGPGSYTGLRIGLSTAKGFCYALDKPLLLHNRLELMLLEAAELHPDSGALAILPARLGEYYVAISGDKQVAPAHMMTPELERIVAEMEEQFVIIGDPGDFSMSDSRLRATIKHEIISRDVWANKAYSLFEEKRFADIAYSEPEYLKSAYITSSRADR